MRRTFLRSLIALLSLVLLTGCESMKARHSDQHAAQVRALDAVWKRAAARRDLDAMMAIHVPDAQELLPGTQPIVGREALRAFRAGLMEQIPRFAHDF